MLDKKEPHFCVVIYYKASTVSRNWQEHIHKIALKYATNIGLLLTHFEFSPTDESRPLKVYRYVKRNQKKLDEALRSRENKGVDFYCTEKDGDFFNTPMNIRMLNEEPMAVGIAERKCKTDYGVFVFESKLDIIAGHCCPLSFCQIILKDLCSIANVRLGFVTVMEGKKYPSTYFFDSASSIYLSEEEKREVETWRKESMHFETKIRGIYWGNIISRGHWANNTSKQKYLLTKLKHECEGRAYRIDNEKIFFCAPFDILDYDQKEREMERFRKRIRKIYENCEIEVLT